MPLYRTMHEPITWRSVAAGLRQMLLGAFVTSPLLAAGVLCCFLTSRLAGDCALVLGLLLTGWLSYRLRDRSEPHTID